MSEVSKRWMEIYKQKGALWFHDGNPKRPHALLTSGNHSDGFFNSELVMEDPASLDGASSELVDLLLGQGFFRGMLNPNRVVGPAMGAITLAHDVARHMSLEYDYPCMRSYVEKETIGINTKMVFRRTSVQRGEKVLLVEDVLTTGDSVEMAAKAVVLAGGIVLPYVAVLVNRSGQKEVGGRKIVALIDQPMHNWDPVNNNGICPLCATGSEAIRPKNLDNWARLNADY